MRQIILILILIILGLGGCAVTVRSLQPTINTTALAWVEARTRTDPVDDLVRFRQAERAGRASSILLPVFALLSLALLLLLLTTPLPRILKELRLLRKAGHKPRRQNARPQPWLEQSAPPPPNQTLPAQGLSNQALPEQQPLFPPPSTSGWLENE